MFIKQIFQMFNFLKIMFSKDAILHLKLCSQEILYLTSTDLGLTIIEMVVERLVPKNIQWATFHNFLWKYSIVSLSGGCSLRYRLVTTLGSRIRHAGIESNPTCKGCMIVSSSEDSTDLKGLWQDYEIMQKCLEPVLMVPNL